MTDNIELLVIATQESWRRWGSRGHAEYDRFPDQILCKVGVLLSDASFDVRGCGRIWADAFRDADKKVSA